MGRPYSGPGLPIMRHERMLEISTFFI